MLQPIIQFQSKRSQRYPPYGFPCLLVDASYWMHGKRWRLIDWDFFLGIPFLAIGYLALSDVYSEKFAPLAESSLWFVGQIGA